MLRVYSFDIAKHAKCLHGNCTAFPNEAYPPRPDIAIVESQCEIRQELVAMARSAQLLPGHMDTIHKAINRIDNLTESYLCAVNNKKTRQSS